MRGWCKRRLPRKVARAWLFGFWDRVSTCVFTLRTGFRLHTSPIQKGLWIHAVEEVFLICKFNILVLQQDGRAAAKHQRSERLMNTGLEAANTMCQWLHHMFALANTEGFVLLPAKSLKWKLKGGSAKSVSYGLG